MISPLIKTKALIWMAKQLVGVTEVGGNNRGAMIERFQRAVDNQANGEPWCVGFVQFCVHGVDDLLTDLFGTGLYVKNKLPLTESTQELWRRSEAIRTALPSPGAIVVWQQLQNPSLGHCGIVTESTPHGVFTIEGNTGSGDQRDGDGVWSKIRVSGDIPGFRRLGYIQPWGNE